VYPPCSAEQSGPAGRGGGADRGHGARRGPPGPHQLLPVQRRQRAGDPLQRHRRAGEPPRRPRLPAHRPGQQEQHLQEHGQVSRGVCVCVCERQVRVFTLSSPLTGISSESCDRPS